MTHDTFGLGFFLLGEKKDTGGIPAFCIRSKIMYLHTYLRA